MAGMPARELTDKERYFARTLATGATQAAAYAAVYSAKGSAATQRANGHRIAKKPLVMAEIKRLRRLPAVDDYTAIKTKMIERLLEIAENDANSVAQHRAIVTLIKYADEGAGQEPMREAVNVAELVRELMADAEPGALVKWPEELDAVADDDLMTPSVQVSEPHVEKERDLLLDKPQLTRPVNPAFGAAEAKAQAFSGMREAEARAHEQCVRASRVEVRRLGAIYAEQREAAISRASEPVNGDELLCEEAREVLIDQSACTALPRAYLQACGLRPGFRRETIPGRFPPQYKWVRTSEGEEA